MDYEWDDEKNASNLRKHGVAFDAMNGFDWGFATTEFQYFGGEERELVTGPIGSSLYAAIVTERLGVMRIISLRIATSEEKRRWRREFQDD